MTPVLRAVVHSVKCMNHTIERTAIVWPNEDGGQSAFYRYVIERFPHKLNMSI